MLYPDERRQLIAVVDDLVTAGLLDCTGGMAALRCAPDRILLTTFGAAFRRWRVGIDDFIVCDSDGEVVEKQQHAGPGGLLMVLEIFRSFPLCNAVLHAHAPYSLAFASLGIPLGDTPCLRAEDQHIKEEYLRNPYPVKVPSAMPNRPDVVAVSQQLVPQIHERLGHRQDELADRALAYTSYRHGITVFARDIDIAFNALAEAEAMARTRLYASTITKGQAVTVR